MSEHEMIVRFLCAHECGHLLIGRLLGGVELDVVEIRSRIGETSLVRWHRVTDSRSRRHALRLAAGMAAEKLLYGEVITEATTDAQKIRNLGFSVEDVLEEALVFLKRNKKAFLTLYRFVKKQVLEGKEVISSAELSAAGVLPG